MDEPVDLGEVEGVKQHKKAVRLANRARKDVVKGLMATVEGRTWVFDMLARCGIFRTSFSTDALQMAFKEGERNIGLVILNDVDLDDYTRMIQERQDGRREPEPSAD